MKYIALAIITLVLSGCHSDQVITPGKTEVLDSKCPQFTTKLRISVEDLNSTHGAISWSDVSRIESFLEAKKKFNKSVSAL